jgi:putative sigma-54 modulation protein
MHLTITGRNMDVTPALREYAEEKIGKMEKYLHKITSAHIILTVEKYRHVAEVTIQAHGMTLKGLEETGDMYSSIDKVMDKIEIQAHKLKEKVQDKNKGGNNHTEEAAPEPSEAPEKTKNRFPRILRDSSFDPKPMSVEEASLQLQAGDEPFLIFMEARTGKVNVLYRRDDGDFALVESR